MNINTINLSDNHQKSVISDLKIVKSLPFKEVLSNETIAENLENIAYRERIFIPDVTLWAFLSQVLGDDQSQQAAVARVIAFFVSQGLTPPSANTSAYSQARSRLPEETLSNLTRSVARQIEKNIPIKLVMERKKS